jgi:hypothetical protein
VPFEIEGKTLGAELSSFAVSQWLNEQGWSPEVVLLYPVSLPFQPHLLQNERFTEGCNGEF